MDILDRLRDMASKKYRADWSGWVQKQCSEAADEIERLRSDNAGLRNKLNNSGSGRKECCDGECPLCA